MDSLEIRPRTYDQLVFERGAKMGQNSLSTKGAQTIWYTHANNEFGKITSDHI